MGTPKARSPDCMEAQDFRRDDTYLVYTCYRDNGEKAEVMGVDLRTKAVTTSVEVVRS